MITAMRCPTCNASGRTGSPNQVCFALAVVMKTLLVMACNEPGPYRANDGQTAEELAEMLAGYLGIRLR